MTGTIQFNRNCVLIKMERNKPSIGIDAVEIFPIFYPGGALFNLLVRRFGSVGGGSGRPRPVPFPKQEYNL